MPRRIHPTQLTGLREALAAQEEDLMGRYRYVHPEEHDRYIRTSSTVASYTFIGSSLPILCRSHRAAPMTISCSPQTTGWSR